jgi:hypothetical protein
LVINDNTIIMTNVCFAAPFLSEVIMMYIDWALVVFIPLMMDLIGFQRYV